MDKEKWQRSRLKARHWVRLWWGITVQETLAPLTNGNALLRIIMLPFLLYVVLILRGFQGVGDQIINTWAATQALICALPVFFLLNAILAIFKARKRERELGQWVNHRFVYHAPQHLLTTVVTDADNGRLIPFKVKGLHRGASVELIVKIETGFDDRNVQVQFIALKEQPIIWDGYQRHSMLGFLPRDCVLYITTLKPTPSNPSTVKVYLLSWWLQAAPV